MSWSHFNLCDFCCFFCLFSKPGFSIIFYLSGSSVSCPIPQPHIPGMRFCVVRVTHPWSSTMLPFTVFSYYYFSPRQNMSTVTSARRFPFSSVPPPHDRDRTANGGPGFPSWTVPPIRSDKIHMCALSHILLSICSPPSVRDHICECVEHSAIVPFPIRFVTPCVIFAMLISAALR